MQTVSSTNLKQDRRRWPSWRYFRLDISRNQNRRSAIPRAYYFNAHGAFARREAKAVSISQTRGTSG